MHISSSLINRFDESHEIVLHHNERRKAWIPLSCLVFARYLRTTPRTLENWEQGRAKPNAQAVLLIRMVSQFPDTMKRLESV